MNAIGVTDYLRGKTGYVSKGDAADYMGDVEVWVNIKVPGWWVRPLEDQRANAESPQPMPETREEP